MNPRFFNNTYYTEPKVYELQDSHRLESLGYRQRMKEICLFTDEEIKATEQLVGVFRNGKTVGSLIKIRSLNYCAIERVIEKLENEAVATIFNLAFVTEGTALLKALLSQAKAMSDKYDVMITNPPYIGTSSMEASVKEYAIQNYPNSKTDMFAMFMETGYLKQNGFTAMINMNSWMFIGSYERLREQLLQFKIIVSMIHLGPRAFDTIAGEVVQTTSFILRNVEIPECRGIYFRLVDAASQSSKEALFLSRSNQHCISQDSFAKIPGSPLAYWISPVFLAAFNNRKLGDISYPKQGLSTADNNRFLRFWFELNIFRIATDCKTIEESVGSRAKWFPFNKGGEYRKWYGNFDYVINWYNDGHELKAFPNAAIRNPDYYFKRHVTWSKVATNAISFRIRPTGSVFSDAGCAAVFDDENVWYALGLLNTKYAQRVFDIINPTINYTQNTIAVLPYIIDSNKKPLIVKLVQENVELCKNDWDAFETSWDFARHPLIFDLMLKEEYRNSQWANDRIEKCSSLTWLYQGWESECRNRFNTLKANEEELNRIFIDIYGLQEELTPEVEDKDVTVRLADKERDIKSLISYLIGIVMGRYSLDIDGLAYAGGNWDASKYITYQPDDDGIVPIYTTLGMEDSLTSRVIELIKLIYGPDFYRHNIDFIAEALGKNNNESSEETLNRYLNDGFYTDHLKIYQKRPIYWMFSSGKYSGFKCLVYMHRYTEDTLALINGKYFLPESTRLKNDMEELNNRINSAEGRDKIRFEKERQKLAASYNEAIEYGQVLDHMANKYIAIDLDDGVKVNYAKFQSVELVTDSGTKVKKDLLVPIK